MKNRSIVKTVIIYDESLPRLKIKPCQWTCFVNGIITIGFRFVGLFILSRAEYDPLCTGLLSCWNSCCNKAGTIKFSCMCRWNFVQMTGIAKLVIFLFVLPGRRLSQFICCHLWGWWSTPSPWTWVICGSCSSHPERWGKSCNMHWAQLCWDF